MITITVPVGKIRAVKSPGQLKTNSLGSCVACVFYHPETQIGGMAHVMLPSSDLYIMGDNPLKYANEAIPCLIQLLNDMGAETSGLQARIVGGAMMVQATEDIGTEVSDAVKQQLKEFNIPLVGERIEGTVNRSARLDTGTGVLWYTEASGVEKVL
jgi:chemotaxis protein CheD